MDWDPIAFMPGIREYLIPEIDKLNRMGATMTSLATLQSMVASRLEDVGPLFHWIHFGFNSLTIVLFLVIAFLIGYRCYSVYTARQRQFRAQQLDLAVRTALNGSTSLHHLYPPEGSLTLDRLDSASVVSSAPRNQIINSARLSYRPSSLYDTNISDTHTHSTPVPR